MLKLDGNHLICFHYHSSKSISGARKHVHAFMNELSCIYMHIWIHLNRNIWHVILWVSFHGFSKKFLLLTKI